jgi:hypothetical protein
MNSINGDNVGDLPFACRSRLSVLKPLWLMQPATYIGSGALAAFRSAGENSGHVMLDGEFVNSLMSRVCRRQ